MFTSRLVLPLLLLCILGITPAFGAPRTGGGVTRHPRAVPRQSGDELLARDTSAHVILISIDGLRPETYLRAKEMGVAVPTLTRLMKEGAYAQGVRAIYPSTTYPSHTTIITGVRSAKHGVYGNTVFSPDRSGPAPWYWYKRDIRVPTLWQIAHDAGLSVANLSWPVSAGCPCDWNIPEIWDDSSAAQTGTMDILRAQSVPRDLIDDIGAATTPWTDANYNINALERDLLVGDAAAWMFTKYHPNLFTIHLIEVDHFSHEEGANGPQALQALEHADRAIGTILAAVEASKIRRNTTVVIVGDHGFANIERQVHINEWLKEGGFLTTDGQGKITAWQAQGYTSAAAGVIMLKDPTNKGLGQQIQSHFLRRLQQLPEKDRPFRIIDRAELDALAAFPGAAFGLALNPGWNLTKKVDAGLVSGASGGTHGYHPGWDAMQTGFIAWGAGVNPHGKGPVVPMTTIGPTIARFLGLRLPAAESQPLEWVFAN